MKPTRLLKLSDALSMADISIGLLQFVERDITIVYAPALDLAGYGNSADEARRSFKTTLTEFFRYTQDSKTLFGELQKLGWKVDEEKSPIKLVVPTLDEVALRNDYVAEILSGKAFKKFEEVISVPC